MKNLLTEFFNLQIYIFFLYLSRLIDDRVKNGYQKMQIGRMLY